MGRLFEASELIPLTCATETSDCEQTVDLLKTLLRTTDNQTLHYFISKVRIQKKIVTISVMPSCSNANVDLI